MKTAKFNIFRSPSNFNSGSSRSSSATAPTSPLSGGRRRSNSDPYDNFNRDRIAKVSRNIFDNEDFKRVRVTSASGSLY